MSDLESRSTSNASFYKRCLGCMCRCDISDHSCDESIPMIVRNGELVRLGNETGKSPLRSRTPVCACCCPKQRDDVHIDSDNEAIRSDRIAPYCGRQVSFEERCESSTEEETLDDITNYDSERDACLGYMSSPWLHQSHATCYIPKSPTDLPSDFDTDKPLQQRYPRYFTYNRLSSEALSKEVRVVKSTPLLEIHASLQKKMAATVSESDDEHNGQNNLEKKKSKDVKVNVPEETESIYIHKDDQMNNDKIIKEIHHVNVNSFDEERNGNVKEDKCESKFPVESSENSDEVCTYHRRKKMRGKFYGAEATKTVLMSVLRSISRRRKSRNFSKSTEESDSDNCRSDEGLLGGEKYKHFENSSDEDFHNTTKNRSKRYRKNDLRNAKKKIKFSSRKRHSFSVPAIKDNEERFSSKFQSEQTLNCKRNDINEYYELTELINPHGDADAHGLYKETFTKVCVDREVKTYVDKENQCNIIDPEVLGINQKFINKQITGSEGDNVHNDRVKVENRTIAVGTSPQLGKTSTDKIDCSRRKSLAHPVLTVETNDAKNPHHFILAPNESKSKTNFFTRYDPSIHGIHRSPTREMNLRTHFKEFEYSSEHSNEIQNKSITKPSDQSYIKSDHESQTDDELTALLIKLPTKEDLERSMAQNSKLYTIGYATTSQKEFSKNGISKDDASKQMFIQDSSASRTDQPLDEKSSKKKFRNMWSLSNIFKKRRNSRSTDAPGAGLPQMHGESQAVAEGSRKGAKCPRCGGCGDGGGGVPAWGWNSATTEAGPLRSLEVMPHTIRHSVNTSKRIVSSGPHSTPLPAAVNLRRRLRGPLSPPPLQMDADDHRKRFTPAEEAERRPKYRAWPWRQDYDGDMCPFKDFQTW